LLRCKDYWRKAREAIRWEVEVVEEASGLDHEVEAPQGVQGSAL
jgi:hypothetical protein